MEKSDFKKDIDWLVGSKIKTKLSVIFRRPIRATKKSTQAQRVVEKYKTVSYKKNCRGSV